MKHRKYNFRYYSFLFIFFVFFSASCYGKDTLPDADKIPFEIPEGIITVAFAVTSDIQYSSGKDYHLFRGVCERIKFGGKGDFMVSPGDVTPPRRVFAAIKKYISADYLWYPVVGNHDLDSDFYMDWLRAYNKNGNTLPNIVNTGPLGTEETTYSFEVKNTHFVIVNQYYDGKGDNTTDGDISDPLYMWLEDDLRKNKKPVIFIFGHEPSFPRPDEESGRKRHQYDSLNKYPENRDRFWKLLKTHAITAYVCGHTHGYSTYSYNGVLQVDAGHSRGIDDTGAKSTFLMFYIMADNSVWLYTYRLNSGSYPLYEFIKIR